MTGTISIQASGSGGSCNYYVPSTREGFAYMVSSTSLAGGTSSTGGWSLQLFNQGGVTGIILNTDNGSWTTGSSVHGTITSDPTVMHGHADVDIVKVVGQQHAHLVATIDCA